MASIFFVTAVLGQQRKTKYDTVDPEWLRLINNFESFIKYPWGRVAFEQYFMDCKKISKVRLEAMKSWLHDVRMIKASDGAVAYI